MKKLLAYGSTFLCVFFTLVSSGSAQQVTILDTVYVPPGYAEGQLLASVYIPAKPNGVGVVLTHGISATRKQMDIWCDTLAARGYVAMTIDYYDITNTTHGGYPKPVRAFKTAVQFLRRNASRFGISTANRIGGIGLSQGSIVWGQTVIWDNDYEFFQTDSTISDRLDALVTLYGLFDTDHFLTSSQPLETWLTTYFQANPALRSTKGDCIANFRNITSPVLLFHGTADPVLQYLQSVQLDDSIAANGGSVELRLFQGAGHEFDLNSTEDAFTASGLIAKDTVLAFFRRTLEPSGPTFVYAEAAPSAPDGFRLFDNYPNPFNPTTNIRFTIVSAQSGSASAKKTADGSGGNRQLTSVKVYDVLGREVATLVDEVKEPGTYTVQFSGSGLASGVYFYRLTAGSYLATRRMMLVR
jgi:dienelactone hydrolase